MSVDGSCTLGEYTQLIFDDLLQGEYDMCIYTGTTRRNESNVHTTGKNVKRHCVYICFINTVLIFDLSSALEENPLYVKKSECIDLSLST